MNTLISSKSELIDKISTELVSSVGYQPISMVSYVLLSLLLSAIIIPVLVGLVHYKMTKDTARQKRFTLFSYYITLAIPSFFLLLLNINLLYKTDNNSKIGITNSMVKSCLTSKTEIMVLDIETAADLKDYNSKYTICGLVQSNGEEVRALNLSLSGTNFIEDNREYLVVSVETFRLNSPKIKSLITPELASEIEQSADYGDVKEIHYNPKKQNDTSTANPSDSIVLKDIKVQVNTDVSIEQK